MTCNRRNVLAIIPLVTVGLACGEGRQRKITLVSPHAVHDSLQGIWLKLIYAEAFRQLGYSFEYESYPSARSSIMSDSGLVDGEISRVEKYGDLHPNMIRLGVSHFSGNIAAYAKLSVSLKNGWDGLKYSKYRVDYRRGSSAIEAELMARVKPSNLSMVNTVESGLRKLMRGNADLFVDVEFGVDAELKRPEFRNAAIGKISTIDRFDAYCFLHKANADLVMPLTDTISKMKVDGSIERFRKQADLAYAEKSS